MSVRKFALIVLALFVAVPLFAQIDKAAVEALALDQSKAPLPGVTVTVTRAETGFSAVGVTDVSGIARFVSLAPGTYAVEFTLEGFAPVKEPKVALLVGQNAKLSVMMQAKASETITVSATPDVVDIHKTDSSTNIVESASSGRPMSARRRNRLARSGPSGRSCRCASDSASTVQPSLMSRWQARSKHAVCALR